MLRAQLSTQPHFEIVGIADGGREAVTLAEELHPDVIVMDVNMPGLDGIDATQQIRELPGSPKVVLVTGAEEDFGARPYEAGAAAYLRKSLEVVGLIDVIVAVSQLAGAGA